MLFETLERARIFVSGLPAPSVRDPIASAAAAPNAHDQVSNQPVDFFESTVDFPEQNSTVSLAA